MIRNLLQEENKLNLQLDDKINNLLNIDILEKMSLILEQSKKFMRLTHQKILTKEYLFNAIKSLGYDINYINANKDNSNSISENINNEETISISQFLAEPIIPKPLNTTIFYHWFCIQGLCPKTSVNHLENKKYSQIKNEQSIINITDNQELVIKMSKNTSKELICFALNFENTFQKIIKDEYMALDTCDLMEIEKSSKKFDTEIPKEMEINATIIKLEPEIVQLFSYFLLFLEENIKNKEILKVPRIQYLILYHIKVISINKYFNLKIYLNNIVELLISLLLYSNNEKDPELIDDYIYVKKEIINFLYELIEKFPQNIDNLIFAVKQYILPINTTNEYLMKSLVAITTINIFGYKYIINYLYPLIHKLHLILGNENVVFKFNNSFISIEKNNKKLSNTNSSNDNHANQIENSLQLKSLNFPLSNDYYGYSYSQSNVVDNSILHFSSLNQNNSNFMNQNSKNVLMLVNPDSGYIESNNIATFIYKELFNSTKIILNEVENKETKERAKQIKMDLMNIFEEDIINLIIKK